MSAFTPASHAQETWKALASETPVGGSRTVRTHGELGSVFALDGSFACSYKRGVACARLVKPPDWQETAMTISFPLDAPPQQLRSATRGRSLSARRRQCRPVEQAASEPHVLATYISRDGSQREVIARSGAGDSTLVIDRGCGGEADLRLVAHLAADEPTENAVLVCGRYLGDLALGDYRCRCVTAEDLETVPFAGLLELDDSLYAASPGLMLDSLGRSYTLERLRGRLLIPELRWCRRDADLARTVSVREAVAALESYEPIRTLTLRALHARRHDEGTSTSVLGAELVRLQASPIVLNRALREAVQRAVQRDELSMSEIAIRCGRVKRDRRGNEAGETSWLARRIGLAPDGGHSSPTPWIHCDVLALIARNGLGVSPREVEL
jgi:hypothetical protein